MRRTLLAAVAVALAACSAPRDRACEAQLTEAEQHLKKLTERHEVELVMLHRDLERAKAETEAATRLAARCPAASIKVSVVSEPPGARVRIDDVPVGVTPLELSRPEGERVVLRLELDGYQPSELNLTVGEAEKVSVALRRRPVEK